MDIDVVSPLTPVRSNNTRLVQSWPLSALSNDTMGSFLCSWRNRAASCAPFKIHVFSQSSSPPGTCRLVAANNAASRKIHKAYYIILGLQHIYHILYRDHLDPEAVYAPCNIYTLLLELPKFDLIAGWEATKNFHSAESGERRRH